MQEASTVSNKEILTQNDRPIFSGPMPPWRQPDFSQTLRAAGYDESRSFLEGREVPYGTLNSVRPENFKPGSLGGLLRRMECVDVRSGDVTTSVHRYRLARLAAEQARFRLQHLPSKTVYKIVIDARGQKIPLAKLDRVIDRAVSQSDETVPKSNISAIR